MSNCVADVGNNSNTAEPAAGLQNAAEVSALPANTVPSGTNNPQEPHRPSRSKQEPGRRTGAGRQHRSRHHHRSPAKKTSTGKQKGAASVGKLFQKKDAKGSDGQRNHTTSRPHRSRHHSPEKRQGRSRSTENTLDARHRGHRHARSPDRRHGHRSPHHRSPHRSRLRSPHRSPNRRRSPYRPHHRSPPRRGHSSDPYRRYNSPERYNRGSDGPGGTEAPSKEASRTPEPSLPLEESVLREAPALDRLNREPPLPTLHRDDRLYGEDSLLLKASSMERAYKGESLLRDVVSRNQRDAYRDAAVPRARTPDSDSAYKRYSSLLRGRSPERTERESRHTSRGSSPEPLDRTRSLGRDASPTRRYESEDEEDDDHFVAAKVHEYYSTLRTDAARPSKPTVPEPKTTYKENPRDLSI